ncbi:hypothetical protein, partial [Gemmiger formicilis]|uniref:hypothetical protein n=1 Tax=Gemmiger formicilis TaxID=745368 RepID=UPI003FD7EC9C
CLNNFYFRILSNFLGSLHIIIQLFHTVDGKVIALNFGKDGYMVTIVPGQEIICEYDGKCLNFKG